MKDNLRFFPVFLYFILITGIPYGSMAADQKPLPPSQVVTSDGLLTGMTPGNHKIPSGWSVVITQDFESGTLSGREEKTGEFTTVNKHAGSKSLRGLYSKDADAANWALSRGNLGSFSEVYLSYFEYTESQARFNDEYWIGQFKKTVNGVIQQEIIVDWMWVPDFNSTTAHLYFVPQSDTASGINANYGGTLKTVPVGTWVQWEVHYRPNTPGNKNGFIRVYKDGSLWESKENTNLNGSVDMTDMSVMASGIYTKLTWVYGYPKIGACSEHFGSWAPSVWDGGPRVTDFDNCYCANNCPPDGKVPKFYRYLDDIIILKK